MKDSSLTSESKTAYGHEKCLKLLRKNVTTVNQSQSVATKSEILILKLVSSVR